MLQVDYVHQLAFPKLSEAEIECLAEMAKICSFEDGENHLSGRTTRAALLRRRIG